MPENSIDARRSLLRRCRVAVGHSAKRLSEDLATFQPPTKSSLWEADKAAITRTDRHTRRWPQRRILQSGVIQASHKIANLADHLRALETVVAAEPMHLYVPASLTRVCIEAAAGVAYLLEPAVPHEERLLRSAGLMLESFYFETVATAQLDSRLLPDAAPTAAARLDKLVVATERAGLDVRVGSNGRPTGIRWAGAPKYRSIPPVKITELVNATFSEYPALYAMSSGVAHGMSWMLDDNASIPDTRTNAMSYSGDPYSIGAAAITAIASAEVVIRAFGLYMGYDPEERLTHYRRRRQALDQHVNAFGTANLTRTGRF